MIGDHSFAVDENSPNGTPVGTLAASDPDLGDMLLFAVTGGTGDSAFAVDAPSGEISVVDTTQLDFETTPSFTLDLLVTDAGVVAAVGRERAVAEEQRQELAVRDHLHLRADDAPRGLVDLVAG